MFIPFYYFPFFDLLVITKWLEYFLYTVLKWKQGRARSLEVTLVPSGLIARCQDR